MTPEMALLLCLLACAVGVLVAGWWLNRVLDRREIAEAADRVVVEAERICKEAVR